IAVCLMLSLPRIMCEQFENEALSEPLTAPSNAASKNETSFLSAINPPLKGEILWVEAQEHYVQITTSEEKRMVLARFSDILRELSSQLGEQTHRSHWVANQAIVKEVKKGQSLKLLLTTGDIVPVSRSFKNQIKRK
ncbi:MAG: LytTR family DNA-binding domain-containing protein, partial [Nitratireductor sp.]